MNTSFKHLKKKCAGCEKEKLLMSKEHVFPKWLILKTNTHKTGIRWITEKWVSALSCTMPLCHRCNKLFGKELESPVSVIFNTLESGKGISDYDCELLIRWLWKTRGLFWHIGNIGNDTYTHAYTLKERILQPIDQIRGNLVIAIARFEEVDPSAKNLPMGIDSTNEISAIFVSGVFSKLAILVIHNDFVEFVPDNFTCYKLKDELDINDKSIAITPRIAFSDGRDATSTTQKCSNILSMLHDGQAITWKMMLCDE
jgi:hypothetical protein